MQLSIIVPVHDRPAAVDSLLQSLTRQTLLPKEVIVVDDGSGVPCRDTCDRYRALLPLQYFYIEHCGPSGCRNYGTQHATGDFFLFLDSDVTLPEDYMAQVSAAQESDYCAVFGGQDRAHSSFSSLQKAISYAMTAFFTTGGIRGGKGRTLDSFYPRSYNMGVARDAFETVGGFAALRYGEDIDLSLRLTEAGFRCRLIPEAWVWHARRDTFRQFFGQVYHSGAARIALRQRHPQSMKMVHLLPAMFTLVSGALCLTSVIGAFFSAWMWLFLSPLLLYSLLILIDAYRKSHSLHVALLSIAAAFVQLTGYGIGFLAACMCRRENDKQ